MRTHVVHESNIPKTPRVQQVSSMFDVSLEQKLRHEVTIDMPLDEKPWNIGLIVGPSGCGKTTLARQCWPDRLDFTLEWPSNESVLDAFPAEMGVKEVVGMLTAVGFGSPPSWMRPFHTLSNGEQFRVSMARLLATDEDPVVVDEFTSVVDRQVAKVVSHTVQKTARRQNRRLIALSCHYDVIDWLQPDWVVQPAEETFTWRSVQPRPRFELAIHEVDQTAWRLFSHHHYLSGALSREADCYGGFVEGQIVAFASYVPYVHPSSSDIMMGHRGVVLPDWQGLGILGRMDDWLGLYLWRRGYRYHNTVSHPASIRHFQKSPRWRQVHTPSHSVMKQAPLVKNRYRTLRKHQMETRFLGTYGFEYVPPFGASPRPGVSEEQKKKKAVRR